MKKYLVYSDVHFCTNSSIVRKRGAKYSARLHNLIDSISWAEHKAESLSCDGVICAGDFFDKSDISAEEITALQDVYFSKLPHIFITGNHEANIASLSFSTANIFKSINAHVVTDTECYSVTDNVEFYFIPYITSDSVLYLKDYVHDNNKKKVVFAHNDLAGVQYGKFVSKSGFDINNILDNCTLFIDGHLHNSCTIKDRILLVGNLTGLNFNENAQKYRHYVDVITVDDSGSITVDPIVNPYAYNFYKLYINNINDLQLLDTLDTNAVLSIVCNSDLAQTVDLKLSKMTNVAEYKLLLLYSGGSNSSESDESLTTEDHIQQFITYIQSKIESSDILLEELSLLGSQ